jgi:hypothetical protein
MTMTKRTKLDVLRLILDHKGEMTWYPISTFFPVGSIEDDASLSGGDVVKEYVAQGLVEIVHVPEDFDRYRITEAGKQFLEGHERAI